MTTKTTPSSTGTASRRRRVTNVSICGDGGPRNGPPYHSSEGGYAPLGLPRPRVRSAPGNPWRSSIAGPPMLFIEPGLPEGQVVLDGVHGEALHARARDDDLLRRVHRDPHHLLGQDVLHLAVELLAFRLVEAAARLLDQRVHAGIGVARRVPPGRRHLLAVEERVQ